MRVFLFLLMVQVAMAHGTVKDAATLAARRYQDESAATSSIEKVSAQLAVAQWGGDVQKFRDWLIDISAVKAQIDKEEAAPLQLCGHRILQVTEPRGR